jgi:hypothetical protein
MGCIRNRVRKLEETTGIGVSRSLLTEAEVERLRDLEKANEQGNLEGGAHLDLLFLRIKASGERFCPRRILEHVETLKSRRSDFLANSATKDDSQP